LILILVFKIIKDKRSRRPYELLGDDIEIIPITDTLKKTDNETDVLYDLPNIQFSSYRESTKSHIFSFLEIIKKFQIRQLYHFTDEENIESIKQNGGLYSWHTCMQKGIIVNKHGSNELSRKLDLMKGLENYVRLSFNPYQPMLYVAKMEGRIIKPVVLVISTEVIYWADTLFSNINATSKGAQIGGSIEDFKKINFNVVLRRNWRPETKAHYQAEVLVNEKIPLKFILGRLNG